MIHAALLSLWSAGFLRRFFIPKYGCWPKNEFSTPHRTVPSSTLWHSFNRLRQTRNWCDFSLIVVLANGILTTKLLDTYKQIYLGCTNPASEHTHTYTFNQRPIQFSTKIHILLPLFPSMKHNFHKDFSTEKRALTVGVRHRWTLLSTENNNKRKLFINWNTCISYF